MKKLPVYPLLGLLMLFCFQYTSAQNTILGGKVIDSNNSIPLVGAHVIVEDIFTGKQIAGITNDKGIFVIRNVSGERIHISISFMGYNEFQKELSPMPGFNPIGEIKLIQSTKDLEEVSITKSTPMAVIKEDTIEYNSDAYKTTPDASGEDLVAKMPGVEVSEGSVKAQGERVKKLLVDGRPFFNNDPSLALRNLPAEIIEKIQVYEEQSEQSQFTGFDDGNRIRTMNVITRRNMRNGQFGKFYAGAGPDEKYGVSGNLNSFNGDRRITLLGQSNNLNQQDFSAQDLLGSLNMRRRMGGGGMRGMGTGGRTPGGGGQKGQDFMTGKKDGVSTINSFGLNYTDSWGEKVDASVNYFFNHMKNYTQKDVYRQYLMESMNGMDYTEFDEVESKNGNHRIFARINYQPNERNRIMFRPNISIQNNEYNSILLGETFDESNMISRTSSDFISSGSAINGSTDLLLMHRFEKTRRSVSLHLSSNFSNRKGKNYLLALNEFYQDELIKIDSLDQYSETSLPSNSISARLAYTEPVSENSLIQFSYRYSRNWNESDRRTWDYDPETSEYSSIDSLISGIFDNSFDKNQAGVGYRFMKNRTMLMAGINYENTLLNNDQEFPNPISKRYAFNSILPNAMFNLRGENGKNLRLIFRTTTDVPSISQLQEVIDNTNSLRLSTGNSNLKQELSHNLIFRYSSANIERSSLFYFGARIKADQDHISSSLFIPASDTVIHGAEIKKGTQLTIPENFNGYYSGSIFMNYGHPLEFIRCNLNLNSSVSISRNPGKINSETGYSVDRIIALGLALVSNISDRVDFTISSNTSYSVPVSSFNESLNENYLFQLSRLKLRWILPYGFVFDTRLTHSYYTGLSEGYDQNFTLLNTSIGKKLFKNQRGEVTVSVKDFLNKNQAISRTITENYIEDSQQNVIGRYFMMSFRYDLRRMRGM